MVKYRYSAWINNAMDGLRQEVDEDIAKRLIGYTLYIHMCDVLLYRNESGKEWIRDCAKEMAESLGESSLYDFFSDVWKKRSEVDAFIGKYYVSLNKNRMGTFWNKKIKDADKKDVSARLLLYDHMYATAVWTEMYADRFSYHYAIKHGALSFCNESGLVRPMGYSEMKDLADTFHLLNESDVEECAKNVLFSKKNTRMGGKYPYREYIVRNLIIYGIGMMDALKMVESARKGQGLKSSEVEKLSANGAIPKDLIEYLSTKHIYIPSIRMVIGEMMTVDDMSKETDEIDIRCSAVKAGVKMADVMNKIGDGIRRSIEGCRVKRDFFTASEENYRKTVRQAGESHILDYKSKTVTAENIICEVSEYYGVSVEGLKSKSREQIVSVPRKVAMFLCYEMADVTLSEIGRELGNRDYSTVEMAIHRITDGYLYDDKMKAEIDEIINMIRQSDENADSC